MESSKLKIISTLLSILFTFCPPGPEDLENRHLISLDGITNVLDVVQIINYILGNIEFTEEQKIAADINKDGIVNILDAISIVQTLLD